MKSQAAAFAQATTSLHRLGIPGALPALHAAGLGISRSILGGSHSVAVYPPIDSLTPFDASSVVDAIDCGRETSLYVHIAFCETRCTFCHYAVQHYAGRGRSSEVADLGVTRYLDALKKELALWGGKLAESATAVSSIYVGGGTPLLLEQEALGDILRTIRNEYDVLPDAELCVEGSPLTITAPDGEDKLRFLKERGVSRLSFGVQSFDDAVLKYAARGYKRDVPIRASSIAARVFDNWNIDLIQGLYKGSPHETWRNLEAISGIRPPHLTWYHGRFADRPQGDWYKMDSRRADFEDESATLLGRMLIWQEMAALGYRQTDGNRFVRDGQYVDRFKKIRTSSSSNLLGVGAASYSHVGAADGTRRAHMFRNEANIGAYIDCVSAGSLPIATGRMIDDEELLAASYATGLRNGRVECSELRSIRKRKPELSAHYEKLERTLRDIGICEHYRDDGGQAGVRLSTLGRLFEDETLALFFSPAVKTALALKLPDWARIPSVPPPALRSASVPASAR